MKVTGFAFNVGTFDLVTDLLYDQLLLVTLFPCKHRPCALHPKITKKKGGDEASRGNIPQRSRLRHCPTSQVAQA